MVPFFAGSSPLGEFRTTRDDHNTPILSQIINNKIAFWRRFLPEGFDQSNKLIEADSSFSGDVTTR
jgi:hypothetical protein